MSMLNMALESMILTVAHVGVYSHCIHMPERGCHEYNQRKLHVTKGLRKRELLPANTSYPIKPAACRRLPDLQRSCSATFLASAKQATKRRLDSRK